MILLTKETKNAVSCPANLIGIFTNRVGRRVSKNTNITTARITHTFINFSKMVSIYTFSEENSGSPEFLYVHLFAVQGVRGYFSQALVLLESSVNTRCSRFLLSHGCGGSMGA